MIDLYSTKFPEFWIYLIEIERIYTHTQIKIHIYIYIYIYRRLGGKERSGRQPGNRVSCLCSCRACVRARCCIPGLTGRQVIFFFRGHFPFPFGLGRASLFPRGALLLGLGGPWRALLFGLGGLFPLASEGGLCSQVLKRRERDRERERKKERKKERRERETERERRRERKKKRGER